MFRHLRKHFKPNISVISFIAFGISSLIWLAVRSGKKPTRLAYPCQKIAAANSLTFLGWLSAIISGHLLYRKFNFSLKKTLILISLILIFVLGIRISNIISQTAHPEAVNGQVNTSKVVWVKDSRAAKGWTANTNYENKADQNIVNHMADEAVKALTGQATVTDAWTYIFTQHNSDHHDYQPGEIIAIKINANNNMHDISTNLSPSIQVIRAVLSQLITQKGVRQNDIIVYDTTRNFVDYQISGISNYFPNVILNPPNSCLDNEKILNARISKVIKDATYIINMALLRTHERAGVTLSMKNHLGSICDPDLMHAQFYGTTPQTNSLVQLNSHPYIKNKTVLVMDDAIYGLRSGGPMGNPDGTEGIKPYPNSLFFSFDPVALDSVVIDYLSSIGAQIICSSRYQTCGNPRTYLTAAANASLGNYATSCTGTNCSFSYPNIDLVSQDLNPAATPSPTPLMGDINGDNVVNGNDLKLVLGNFIGNTICSTFNCDLNSDGKVNLPDTAFVITNWGKSY